jgi:hypothetical protein
MDGGVVELFIGGSNNPAHPGRMGRGSYGRSGWAAVKPWDFLYLPQPQSDNASLALALFREGMSVNSSPFSFLSYFKVLNIGFPTGPKIAEWVNFNLGHVRYSPALDRLNELKKSNADIGAYLNVQGRCAVAHANSQPIVNPDRYDDKRRLELDLPLMKAIAENFIERELGVLTDSSFAERCRTSDKPLPELLKRAELTGGRTTYHPIDA